MAAQISMPVKGVPSLKDLALRATLGCSDIDEFIAYGHALEESSENLENPPRVFDGDVWRMVCSAHALLEAKREPHMSVAGYSILEDLMRNKNLWFPPEWIVDKFGAVHITHAGTRGVRIVQLLIQALPCTVDLTPVLCSGLFSIVLHIKPIKAIVCQVGPVLHFLSVYDPPLKRGFANKTRDFIAAMCPHRVLATVGLIGLPVRIVRPALSAATSAKKTAWRRAISAHLRKLIPPEHVAHAFRTSTKFVNDTRVVESIQRRVADLLLMACVESIPHIDFAGRLDNRSTFTTSSRRKKRQKLLNE